MTEERQSSAKHQLSDGERKIGKVEILGKRKKINLKKQQRKDGMIKKRC